MSALAKAMTIRGVTLSNRVMISPMCTYKCAGDGMATDWHLVHYGSLALGGAGMVMLEATAVTAEGRHSHADIGIWNDAQIAPLRHIAGFIRDHGAVPAIQLQHTGRKASTRRPWHGGTPVDDEDLRERGESPWTPIGPSPVPYGQGKPVPREIAVEEMPALIAAFVEAARRAVAAGFEIVEVHAAHGYLLNQFLSPISNQRGDAYGGSLQNRMRFPLQLIGAVRAALPDTAALFVRISAVDGVEAGWTLEESVVFSRELKALGVDVVDCSSGGIGGAATMNRLARSPGFQVPLAAAIRHEAGLPTVAVGLILTAEQAEDIAATGQADIIAIGREALANPNWPNAALTRLTGTDNHDHWPSNIGWWLERRAGILRDYAAEAALAR